jgi:HlyD family secretion protein
MSSTSPTAADRFLPAPLTAFVGRERELAGLRALLARRDVQLLTVTGPGGVGKTRLAIEVAREFADGFAAGARFVPLAPLGSPDLVLPAIARTLGIGESHHGGILRDLTEQIASTELLLVLDNVEHLLAAGPDLFLLLAACRTGADDRVGGTGTVEVREYDVSPQVPARVLRVLVDEGELVHRGDTLAALTQATTRADIEQQRARVAAAQANLREAVAGARPSEIDRAEAELRTAEAEAERTARDLERTRPLAESGTVSRQSLDAAQAAADAAAGRRDAAHEALQLLREGTRAERVQAARAEVANARAALAATEAVAQDLVLLAPVDGVVISRNAEAGEMLAAAQSAVTLGEAAAPYVRVFVSTRLLPRVYQGQRAVARLDGYPDRPIPGEVVAISPIAEFTPRVAFTESERADLVFGVKVALTDTTGLLRPGLPATVELEPGPSR